MNDGDWQTFFGTSLAELPPPFPALGCRLPADYSMDRDQWHASLRAAQPEVLVTCWSTPPLPAHWISSGDCALKYVCHLTGSVRRLVPREFLVRGGRVTNWGQLAGREVAEHALLLALAALRRMPAWRGYRGVTGAASATVRLRTASLYGRRVGLHGFGHVARSLVDLLRPFGVEVRAYSEGVPDEVMLTQGVAPCASLAELAAFSEVFFECEALTPQSRRSVTTDHFAALPDGAVFVNVGRAQVVDEAALLKEAAAGRIHLAVDVTEHEPPTPDTPLAQFSDVIISPHVAGPTFGTFPRCGDTALQNLVRYLAGGPLLAELDLPAYDRST